MFVTVRSSDRPVRAESQEVPGGRHEGAGEVHGRDRVRLREDGQGLHPVHEGATHRTRDVPASRLRRSEARQRETEVSFRVILTGGGDLGRWFLGRWSFADDAVNTLCNHLWLYECRHVSSY